MSENELAAKLAVMGAVVIGIIALGYVIVFAIAPIFVVASAIDFGFRKKYNEKLDAIQGSEELDERPRIRNFDARFIEGRVLVGWLTDLPGDAYLDVYRLTGSGGGSVGDVMARGECILSTGREFTNDMSDLLIDEGLPPSIYFYVPIVSGMQVKKEPLPYSFLGFSRELDFTTRRNRVQIRGEAVRVVVAAEEPLALPDDRDDASKLKDEVLAVIKGRKKMDAELDAAILRIREDDDLTEDEKVEAIELMETRAGGL